MSEIGDVAVWTAGSARASRIFLIAMLVVSLLFVACGIAMIAFGVEGGVTGTLFFGTCAAVFVWRLRPDLLETETRSAEALLARYPGPLVLRASVRKTMFVAAGSAVFGGVALWMLNHRAISGLGQVLVWPGVVMFLGGAPLLVLVAILGSTLHLDADGLVAVQLRRSRLMRWRDTSGFSVATMGRAARMVVFDDAAVRGSRMAAINRGLCGRSSALSDTYGMSPDDLATLLAAWCARARAEGV